MGTYINPGNDGFRRIVGAEYVDKTGLIALVSASLNTYNNLTCVSRPRRFGKSFAVESLVAYYSCGCESRGLFEGLEISQDPSFERHLNAYNVIYLDMTDIARTAHGSIEERVAQLLLPELAKRFGKAGAETAKAKHQKLFGFHQNRSFPVSRS